MRFSVSTGKSRSSWLDRLRTAKGFPHDGVTDLENFLQNPNSPNHDERPDPKPNSDPTSHPTQNEGKQLFTIVTDVLHELFNFGDKCSDPSKLKKSARKQAKPRICACPSNSSHENNNAASEKVALLRSGDSNSGVEGVKVFGKLEDEGDGVVRDAQLPGFSRTEVTVIDTSYEVWKFEKLLYRKKNVWKVREKKGKSEIMRSKKKRKAIGAMEEDQHGGKKRKGDEVRGAEASQLPVNEISRSVQEKDSNKVGTSAEKKQTDLNLGDGSSSILVKSIHNGKKDGSGLSRTSLKLKQKKP